MKEENTSRIHNIFNNIGPMQFKQGHCKIKIYQNGNPYISA